LHDEKETKCASKNDNTKVRHLKKKQVGTLEGILTKKGTLKKGDTGKDKQRGS